MTSVSEKELHDFDVAYYEAVPDGDFGVLQSYVRAIGSAREFIYLEKPVPSGRPRSR
jgi:hypothetical protein